MTRERRLGLQLVDSMIGELMFDYHAAHPQLVRKIVDAFVGNLVPKLGVNEFGRGEQLGGECPGCSLIPGMCPSYEPPRVRVIR